MYIRGNKLIELLEEFKSTNPKKEDRIPYEEWRKLVKFLTIYKDFKLQVKTEPSILIITYPASGERSHFNTGDYFIKFFQERPITTIFSSPKFERFWDKDGYNPTFITDDDGNKFMVPNLDFELSDFPSVDFELNDYHISDVERSEVCTWKPLTQYDGIITIASTSSSDTLNLTTVSTSTAPSDYNATTTNSQLYLRLNSYGEHPDWENFGATTISDTTNKTFSKGSSNKMNINLNNLFDFGPMNDGNVMYSPYGLAFRNSNNQYLTYNPTTKKTTDVTGLTIDLEGLIYKIPVGLNSVKSGDIIIHNGKPICVEGVEENSVICVDIENSELKTVIPPTNIFGFNYVTKITPLFNLGSANPSEDNPFGNIMPYLLFSTLMEKDSCETKSGNGFDTQTLLLMSMMNNADGNFFGNIFGNGQA